MGKPVLIDVFNKETEEAYYWGGFLFADGCVRKEYNCRTGVIGCYLKLALANQDIEHLKKFCIFMNLPIEKVKPRSDNLKQHTIKIGSKQLVESLARFGVVQNKTYRPIQVNLNIKLISHFLRGWFDGDGHIKKKKGPYKLFMLAGMYDNLAWFGKQISLLCPKIKYYIYNYPYAQSSELRIHSYDSLKAVYYLLSCPSSIRLERKWTEFATYFEVLTK